MIIQLLFFGALTDVIGENQQRFKTEDDQLTVADLDAHFRSKFPALAAYTYKIALNKTIVLPSHNINEGDEVAFLPPFAGG